MPRAVYSRMETKPDKPSLVLGGRLLADHRARMPLFVAAVERLLEEVPWLAGVPSARRLIAMMFGSLGDELVGAEAIARLLDAGDGPGVRAGVIYLVNTGRADVVAAYHAARGDAEAAARRVPWLAAASVDALDLAVASIASTVRIVRAATRASAA